MKKVIAIVLVSLLMLNVVGYYGLFMGLKYKHSLLVTKKLNSREYSEDETITIKIPLSVPYYGDTDFERVDGEIEHQGQLYRLVKQKLQRDTLHIVCIRDTDAENIHQALADYVKTFTDKSDDHTGSSTVLSLIKDYCRSTFSIYQAAAEWSSLLRFKIVVLTIPDSILSLHYAPPEA